MKNRLKLNNGPLISGAQAYQKEQYEKRLEEYKSNPKRCLNCNKILCYTLTVKNGRNSRKFCTQSCAAIYNNNKRTKTTKGVKKLCKCLHCNCFIEISLHSSFKTTICNECKPTKLVRTGQKAKKCSICNKDFRSTKNKTCSVECAKVAKRNGAVKGGQRSVVLQNRRSKNEICFYELCKTKFSNIANNRPMFNGWDADIIILDYKIAILWNGAWHYKKITQRHSVLQVQNRDKIKLKEIQNSGFTPYVIKDLGKYSIKKVKAEFQIFCTWLDAKLAGESTALSSATAYETGRVLDLPAV